MTAADRDAAFREALSRLADQVVSHTRAYRNALRRGDMESVFEEAESIHDVAARILDFQHTSPAATGPEGGTQ